MTTLSQRPAPDVDEGFFSPDDLVALLPGVSKGTLAMWRYEEKGPPYYKAGKAVLYPRAGFRSWLAAHFHEGGD